jgi:F-type H+-transporting ATPase subunit c
MECAMNRFITLAAVILATPSVALAQSADVSSSAGLIAIAAAVVLGLAAAAGTYSQGKAVSAALDAIGRNPGASGSLFVPLILGLALIESLVIFAFVIAFRLLGKF